MTSQRDPDISRAGPRCRARAVSETPPALLPHVSFSRSPLEAGERIRIHVCEREEEPLWSFLLSYPWLCQKTNFPWTRSEAPRGLEPVGSDAPAAGRILGTENTGLRGQNLISYLGL